MAFLITSRSKKAAEWPPLPNERRFTRVRAACDRCRVKKTKCDGTRPCLRCRHDDAVCCDSKGKEPRAVSAEYVTMLEAQQEQLIKTLRRLHTSSTSSSEPHKSAPSLQELESLPNTFMNDDDADLPHKKARQPTSNPPSRTPSHSRSHTSSAFPPSHQNLNGMVKSETSSASSLKTDYGNYNILSNVNPSISMLPRAATFHSMTDSDMLKINPLDIGPNMGMGMMAPDDNLPELDPTVWDGLNRELFNSWTQEPDLNGNGASHNDFPGRTPTQPHMQLQWSNDHQTGNGNPFCDPRGLEMSSMWQSGMGGWQSAMGMGLESNGLDGETVNAGFLRSTYHVS